MDKPLTVKDLKFEPPEFARELLLVALEKAFGLSGTLKPLAGERDQNHLLTTLDDKKYILKVAGPDEDKSVVDYQIKTLQHIESRNPSLNVPRNLNTLDGKGYAMIKSKDGRDHMMRLLSYIDGVPFNEDDELTPELLFNAGKFQGGISTALSDFSHPSEGYFMPWDSSQGLVLNPSLKTSKDGSVERIVVPLLDHFKIDVIPKMHKMRKQTIHNDGHEDNMLKVAPDIVKFQGVIDFGDIAYAPVIQDLSIPLYGFIGESDDPYATGYSYVKGYVSSCPLFAEELDILYDLILLRGCLTLQLVGFRIDNDDANMEGLLEDYPRLIKRLETLLSLDKEKLTATFHQAAFEE